MIQRAEHSTSDIALAAGAALLATAIGVTQVRLEDEWGSGVHLAVALVPAAALLAAGLAVRRDGNRPRASASGLLLAGLVLWAIADFRLLEVVTGDDPFDDGGPGLTAFFALLAGVALVAALRSGSAASLLVGALAVGGTTLAAVRWLFDTEDIASYRPVLLALAVAYAAGAYALRDRPRHRDVMADAAGLAILAIAQLSGGFLFFFGGEGLPDPWAAVLLVAAVGLVAYTAATRAPGPAVIGLFVFASFASTVVTDEAAFQDGSDPEEEDLGLMGWPVVLLALSLVAFAYGMLSRRRDTNHDPDRAVH